MKTLKEHYENIKKKMAELDWENRCEGNKMFMKMIYEMLKFELEGKEVNSSKNLDPNPVQIPNPVEEGSNET